MRSAIRVVAALVVAGTCAAALFNAPASARRGRALRPPAQPDSPRGQTTTVLADGRLLVIGGEGASGPLGAAVVDPQTGQRTAVPGLAQPRAWHAATVLPDGKILVSGGVGAFGQSATAVEVFDPSAGTFLQVGLTGASPRWGHTSTLLTDGRVLIAGGVGPDGTKRDDAELWHLGAIVGDPEGDANLRAEALAARLRTPRSQQRATLRGDGQVLIEGGGSQSAEVFSPENKQFVPVPAAESNRQTTAVAEAIPSNGATDVSVDARIVARFPRPLRLASVSDSSVILRAGDVQVPALVVAAEGGRLVFVTPSGPLSPQTEYTATFRGLVDESGVQVDIPAITFTTESLDRANRAEPNAEAESWIPDEDARKDWRAHRGESPWQKLPPLMGPAGVTALSGQALRLDGRPLPNVTLSIDGQTTKSDRTGRFLLLLPDMGTEWGELVIDGRSANRGQRRYGVFEAGLRITGGETTVLPYTIWMPVIDTDHAVAIPSPTSSEVVITTPYIPGLELHLPPGTTIRDNEGNVAREITITPIPIDRPPFPLPSGVDIPVYFTIQPGGGYIYTPGQAVKGAWLVYPNYRETFAGRKIQFYHYDTAPRGWYVYGLGTVTADKTQVMPDPTTRIYEFTGAMINFGPAPPPDAEPPGDCCGNDADPVNLWTGLFELQQTDLFLPDVLPLSLTRTYRTRDLDVRPFGVGTTHPYAMFLWSAQQYQQADLVLPDGGRIHFVRTTAGTGFSDAKFEHKETETTSATPTAFYKSGLAWRNPAADMCGGWDLTLKDGTVYVFGDTAPLQAIRDRYGNTVRLTWSTTNSFDCGIGNLQQVTSPHGRWISFTYDASNRITQAKDNIGRTVGYTYDANGNLWKVIDPLNQITEYTYDSDHRMRTVKNRNGVVYVTNEYTTSADAPTPDGWVKTQTFADGGSYQFAYTVVNGKSTRTDVTNPRGYVRRVTFNANGYVLSDTRAFGTADETTMSSSRQAGTNFLTEVIDSLNHRTAIAYDDSGNVLTMTRLAGTPDALTTTYTYEPTFHQVATVTDALNHTTTSTYDSTGNLTRIKDALDHETTLTYNTQGQLTSVTDPLQHTTSFTYTGGDLVVIRNPLGFEQHVFTDSAGRALNVVDPLGRTTSYKYDPLDRMTTVVDPRGGETTFSYRPEGQLDRFTDAKQQISEHTYDTMGRLATRSDPLQRSEGFEYDKSGNIVRSIDRKGQVTTSTYDGLNRLKLITFQDGSTVNYTYDTHGRPTTIEDSLTGTIVWSYDDLDRLTSEASPQGTVAYTYDSAGRRATMSATGQPSLTYSYDAANRLTGMTDGTVTVGMSYDEANRPATLTLPNGVVVEYAYDAASQLTGITYRRPDTTILGDITYSYDASGSRVGQAGTWARTSLPQAVGGASYDAANQLVTWGGRQFAYDANGNVAAADFTSYSWNARNQLAGLTGEINAAFQYDATGRRISRGTSGSTVTFLYDGPNAIQEFVNGAPTARMLAGLGADDWLARIDSSTMRTVLSDGLGSVLATADATAAVSASFTYEPFGRVLSSGTDASPWVGFTGRENDGNGLYYYRARYYDPSAGRFVSEDPLGLAGGVNPFAYVKNSPTNYTDPTGQQRRVPGPPPLDPPLPGCTPNGSWQFAGEREESREEVLWARSQGPQLRLPALRPPFRGGGSAAAPRCLCVYTYAGRERITQKLFVWELEVCCQGVKLTQEGTTRNGEERRERVPTITSNPPPTIVRFTGWTTANGCLCPARP